jgi:hypothetical protein
MPLYLARKLAGLFKNQETSIGPTAASEVPCRLIETAPTLFGGTPRILPPCDRKAQIHVEQQDAGLAVQGAGEHHALLLAASERSSMSRRITASVLRSSQG